MVGCGTSLVTIRRVRIAVVMKMKVRVPASIMHVTMNVHIRPVSQGEIQNPAAKKNDHESHEKLQNRCPRFGNRDSEDYDEQSGSQQ
jgi:hypothetical protein